MRDSVTTTAYVNNMGGITSKTGNDIHCTKNEVFH